MMTSARDSRFPEDAPVVEEHVESADDPLDREAPAPVVTYLTEE